ncbi:MAG: UDP-N-acetylmuramate dehydrogenase [Clostridia bacterium]|nr:UDP-N-acetylmuramate dehydrogenase [Clostridia bacterium]
MNGRIADVLRKRGVAHRTGVPTATLCSFHIGGPVAALAEPCCIGELLELLELCRAERLPFAVIGRGSNLLFDDAPMALLLIRTTQLEGIRDLGNGRLSVLCGTALSTLCRYAAERGYGGMEFAFGIPGTLGGAVCMNAGAHGGSLSDLLECATVWQGDDGEIKTLFNAELNFSYRNCEIQRKNAILLSAVLQLKQDADPQEIRNKMNTLARQRRATQPLELPSAGSVFRRPSPDYPLSAELDRLGLKGLRVGGACVSEKHAGFIVNKGGATAADVRALIGMIQNIVKEHLGFTPSTEIRLIPEEL